MEVEGLTDDADSDRVNRRTALALRNGLRAPRPLPVPAGRDSKHLYGPDPDGDAVRPHLHVRQTQADGVPDITCPSPTPSSPFRPSPPSTTRTSAPRASASR